MSSVVTFSLHALNDFPYTARLIHKSTIPTIRPPTRTSLDTSTSKLSFRMDNVYPLIINAWLTTLVEKTRHFPFIRVQITETEQ